MKFLEKGLLPLLAVVVLTIGLVTQKADAQETRKVQAISFAVQKQMEKIQTAVDKKDFDSAKQLIDLALNHDKTNDYAKSIFWQYSALIAFEEKDTEGAIAAFEQVLEFRLSIPQAQEHGIIYNLSQLYFSIEDYGNAQTYANIWKNAVDPSLISASNYKYFAGIAYASGDYDLTIQQTELALEHVDKTKPTKLVVGLYQLLASANWEKKSYEAGLSAVRRLIALEPVARWCLLAIPVFEALGADKESAIAQARAEAPHCTGLGFREENLTEAFDTIKAENTGRENTSAKTQRAQDTLPVVRVQPQYPRKAQLEGVEGTVIISLTILPDGSVDRSSIRVVEASPPGYFEEAAIKAASLFKYKPKIVAGVPQKIEGVRYSFSFNLAN